ncbi:sporulation histidine kinase inhibitor Sda [Pontibacillus yanchengensis]|uniref:sporulation histidine kinase inhibitor Sda n=1 Tax=Pontibacillus yanchengensis TaxID=462910 RepID=UPI000A063D0C|nr:sporulation histidine kinase inhibitor Sda [Pontibacillus yanchengensis]
MSHMTIGDLVVQDKYIEIDSWYGGVKMVVALTDELLIKAYKEAKENKDVETSFLAMLEEELGKRNIHIKE